MQTTYFKGGIQNGTVATDARARKMDNYCKELRESVFANFKSKDLTVQKKLNQTQIPGGIGACEPDGGAWFYKGILIEDKYGCWYGNSEGNKLTKLNCINATKNPIYLKELGVVK